MKKTNLKWKGFGEFLILSEKTLFFQRIILGVVEKSMLTFFAREILFFRNLRNIEKGKNKKINWGC